MGPQRIIVSVIAIVSWVSAWPATAGQIERQRTYDLPRGQVAVDGLSLRATPTPETEIVGPALWGQRVAIIDDTAAPVMIGGRQDRWILVSNAHCVDDGCHHIQSGWVPDSALAFDGRFEPLDDWRSGTIAGYDDRSVFAYAIEADGMFVRQRLPCTAGGCDPAPVEQPECIPDGSDSSGGLCAQSGQLYRYGNLIRARDPDGNWLEGIYDVILSVSESGDLCARSWYPEDDARMCDRTNSIAPGARDADAALMAAVAYRRERLALIAADVLNLRSEPSTDGEIVGRLPRGSAVERLDIDGASAARGAPSDDWVRVRLIGCLYDEHGNCPQRDPVGWVVDAYLAFEDRLEPVASWVPGSASAYAGDYGYGYLVAADGSFTHFETCGGLDEGFPECTQTGRLYRYRDLILAKSDDGRSLGSLYVDDGGGLCLAGSDPSFEYEDGCER